MLLPAPQRKKNEILHYVRPHFDRLRNLLGQWLNFQTFWDYLFSKENKVQTFFVQGPLAE